MMQSDSEGADEGSEWGSQAMVEEEREDRDALAVLTARTPTPIALSKTPLSEDPLLGSALFEGCTAGDGGSDARPTKYTIDRLLQDTESAASQQQQQQQRSGKPLASSSAAAAAAAVAADDGAAERVAAMRALLDAGNAAAAAAAAATQQHFFVRAPRRPPVSPAPALGVEQLRAGFWPTEGARGPVSRWLFAVAVGHTDGRLSGVAARTLAEEAAADELPDPDGFLSAFELLGGDCNASASAPSSQEAAAPPHTQTSVDAGVLHNVAATIEVLWATLQKTRSKKSTLAHCWPRDLFSALVRLACDPILALPSTPEALLAAETLRKCIGALVDADLSSADVLGSGARKLSVEHALARVAAVPGFGDVERRLRAEAAWVVLQRASGASEEPSQPFDADRLVAPELLLKCATKAEADFPTDKASAAAQLVSVLRCLQQCALDSGVFVEGEKAKALSKTVDALSKLSRLARVGSVKEEILLLTTQLRLFCGLDDMDDMDEEEEKKEKDDESAKKRPKKPTVKKKRQTTMDAFVSSKKS